MGRFATDGEQYFEHDNKSQAVGQLLKRMNEELAARTLTTMPTERLLDGILKLMAESKAVGTELTFGAEGSMTDLLNKGFDTTVTHWSA
jgi:hypothetical protein